MEHPPIEWDDVIEIIRGHRTFLVTSHVDTDGDALASVLSLGSALEALGKEVRMVVDSEIPVVYERLPLLERLERPETVAGGEVPEVGFVLDAPFLERTGTVAGLLPDGVVLVNIDHHTGNTGFGRANVVVEDAPATAYLVHELLKALDGDLLDRKRSAILYVGLLGDTGGFRFPNTNGMAFQMAQEVLGRGVDVSAIAHDFLYGWTPPALKLLALTLGSLKISAGGRIATLEITRSMLEASGTGMKDSEGFVTFASTIPGVVLAVLFKERDERATRASLRSHGSLDVAALAAHFGGGGHRNAAGCTIPGPPDRAREALLEAARPLLPVS